MGGLGEGGNSEFAGTACGSPGGSGYTRKAMNVLYYTGSLYPNERAGASREARPKCQLLYLVLSMMNSTVANPLAGTVTN
jgi:hypothetical protein